MAYLRLFFATLVLTVFALLPTVVLGNKKTGIFNKIAGATRDLQAAAKGGASAVLGGAGRFSVEGFMDAFEELADKQWGTPKTTLDIDLLELMREVFVKEEGHTRLMQEAWGDPEILRALMEDLPIFDMIKPLRALKQKETLTAKDVSRRAHTGFEHCRCRDRNEGEEQAWPRTPTSQLTQYIHNTHPHASQGIDAVLVLKDAMAKVITSLESIRDPERFAEKMYHYATSEDPEWKSLLARIEAGDTSSHLESQQFLLNKEIGDRK